MKDKEYTKEYTCPICGHVTSDKGMYTIAKRCVCEQAIDHYMEIYNVTREEAIAMFSMEQL